ncbi:MAG TPA: hypothetical protein VJC09_00520 [Candidatus Saccharimonadales bacterium]|nr:hypothetical protein [Candidatus Saccharimonadales bacterium]
MTDGPSGDIVPVRDRFVELMPEEQHQALVAAREGAGERIGETALLRGGWEGTEEGVRAAAILDTLDAEPDVPSVLAAISAGQEITDTEVATKLYSSVFRKLLTSGQAGPVSQRARLGMELVDAHVVEVNKNVAFSLYGAAAIALDNNPEEVRGQVLAEHTDLFTQLRTRQMDIIDDAESEDGHIKQYETVKRTATTKLQIPDEVRLRAARMAFDRLPEDRHPEETLEIIAASTDPTLIATGLRDAVYAAPDLKQTWTDLSEQSQAALRRYNGAGQAVRTYGNKVEKWGNIREPIFYGNRAARESWRWAEGQLEAANKDWNRLAHASESAAGRFLSVSGTINKLAAGKLTVLTATDEGRSIVSFLLAQKEVEGDDELFKASLAGSFNEFYSTFAKTGPQVGVTADTLDASYKFLGAHGIIPDLKVT